MGNDLKNHLQDLEKELELYNLVFDSFVNGALITDAAGTITHFNKPYGRFLNLNPTDFIGRHCTEAIKTSRMHIVAKTGIPEINTMMKIQGQNILVHRIPIKKNNQVIAVFGLVMFQDITDISRLAEKSSLLESKVQLYEQELRLFRSTRYSFDSIIGKSEDIAILKSEALRAPSNSFPVWILGESGTGKELFAQSIHHGGPRGIYPFVRINCAAIPRDLLESELFGYDKGAFTGADTRGKPGKFELAHRGTVFLDEVGDLPLEMQPKLLRVLEEKEFERIGGNKVIKSDFRLVAATNRNLEEMIANKLFREDLYYRMNVIQLPIPPLRERRDDIIPSARHLLDEMGSELSPLEVTMDADVQTALLNYHWPGNVRELSNVLERSLTSLEGSTLHLENLPFNPFRNKSRAILNKQTYLRDVVALAEKEAILYALKKANNNKAKTADLLGIHRTLLYKKMGKYGIGLQQEK